jgi:hypothetical protein
MSTSTFCELLSDTGRAVVEDAIGLLELGDPLNVLVGIVEVGVATMIETLMPKEFLRVDVKTAKMIFANVVMVVIIQNELMDDGGESWIGVERRQDIMGW